MTHMNYSLDMLHIDGTIIRGEELRTHVLGKMSQLYKPLSTSLGPSGLDKIIINTLGDVKTTSDGATILASLHADDPFMQLVTRLAQQQDVEAGDGTTTVALLAIALVRAGMQLLKEMPRASVLRGFKQAYGQAAAFLRRNTRSASLETARAVAATSLRGKIGGGHARLTDLALHAHSRGAVPRVFKAPGGGLSDSFTIDGAALLCRWDRSAAPLTSGTCKLVLLDCELAAAKLPLNVHVTLADACDAAKAGQAEREIASRRVAAIVSAGVSLVLSARGIDGDCARSFAAAGVSAVSRCDRDSLVAIAAALGIPLVRSLSDFSGVDVLPTTYTTPSSVQVIEISGEEIITVAAPGLCAVVLRGSTEQLLDEAERCVRDVTCALRRLRESPLILPAGGACEAACAAYLRQLSNSLAPRDAASVRAYAEALLDVPRLVCENAGLNSDAVLAELFSVQAVLAQSGSSESVSHGFDLTDEFLIGNNFDRGVVEPAVIRLKALRTATEAAISVLRIDEMFILNPEKPKPRDECH